MQKNTLILWLLFPSFAFAQIFNPSTEYISDNKNKWSIETPEVQELVHIIMAISPTGIADSNMVEHRTWYYKQVIAHFTKYKDEGIVKKIDSDLREGLYARLKMDACGLYFVDDNIERDETYKRLSWGNTNYISPYLTELEAFAKKSGFREFYKLHQPHYAELTRQMEKQVPVQQQWSWLEDRFPNRYDHYRITFSPLVNGSHSTNRFQNNDFKQTVMFVCGPIQTTIWSEKIKEGLMTRVVFTEIDHNYVNPVSDQFTREINKIFNDRSKWTSGKDSNGYPNAYSVFNEYMTWAVFTLYASDQFTDADFAVINERTEAQMTNRRGFPQFRKFNQKILQLYKDRKPNQTVAELYPDILAWCKNQANERK